MSIYELKPRFQSLLRPFVARLAGAGVTANQVTLAALALSLLGGAAIAMGPEVRAVLLLLPLLLFVRMALNAVDGMLAREHGQISALGGMLNELGDLVSDAALYLPLVFVPGMPGALVVLVVTLGLIVETAGILALSVGATRRYDGPMGKSDRAFLFGALALALGLGVQPGVWLEVVLWVALALCLVTLWNRVRRALRAGAS